ncbi:MAG TPA: hypothetical protein VMH38_00600 [Thermoplasmata archaeon]|nr:hypothetical protein [Thermoplasmata archaeon]
MGSGPGQDAASEPSTTETPPPASRRAAREFEYPAPPGPSTGAILSVFLLVGIGILLVLMVTGYNQQIPYLHPSTGPKVTVAGDRVSVEYQYLSNGSLSNSTIGELCPGCPFTVPAGTTFSYTLEFGFGSNESQDLNSLSVQPPFHLVSTDARLPIHVAAYLSQTIQLTIGAPAAGGVYVLPLAASVSVT